MKRYTKEQIESLLFLDYIKLIIEELEKNGFKRQLPDGKVITYNPSDNFSDFFYSVKDKKACIFLEHIGLINNGRCPITGMPAKGNHVIRNFTSDFDLHVSPAIDYLNGLNTSNGMRGCFILLFIIVLITFYFIFNNKWYTIFPLLPLLYYVFQFQKSMKVYRFLPPENKQRSKMIGISETAYFFGIIKIIRINSYSFETGTFEFDINVPDYSLCNGDFDALLRAGKL